MQCALFIAPRKNKCGVQQKLRGVKINAPRSKKCRVHLFLRGVVTAAPRRIHGLFYVKLLTLKGSSLCKSGSISVEDDTILGSETINIGVFGYLFDQSQFPEAADDQLSLALLELSGLH
jgi:hypothetical protein